MKRKNETSIAGIFEFLGSAVFWVLGIAAALSLAALPLAIAYAGARS